MTPLKEEANISKKHKVISMVIVEILLAVSYFTIGLITSKGVSRTTNLVYIIALALMCAISSFVCYKNRIASIMIWHIVVYTIFGFPYSTFLVNLMVNGRLTNVIYCGAHNDNGWFVVVPFLVLAIVNVVLLVKMKVWDKSNKTKVESLVSD